jgi:1-acyl-sn-glycerol-3-phosphate acyltransferase
VSRETVWYRRWFPLLWLFIRLRFRVRVTGRENVPRGAVMVCANHTSNLDALLLIYALGRENTLHILAKESLFRNSVVARFLRSFGTILVHRNLNDAGAVRAALGYLKNGEKVGVFPEGHRVAADEAAAAKSGAVRLANKTGAPILPVYIPREKPFFRGTAIVIGAPYAVNPGKKRLAPEDTERLSGELMEKIRELEP